jgi:hypothetical protein
MQADGKTAAPILPVCARHVRQPVPPSP